ncbi:pyocin knob domain-containing protein [Bilophila wadsworthia]|uniref:pyocin knob domain-containing protein n=2 Tax=Bilophila wadsworthia TaxID=35833 RepID=UPI0026DBDEB1|nr:pyocin knob domain-containing protein [Bilophila wadsworthia]
MAVKQLPKISPIPEPPNRLVGDQERFDTMTFNSLKAQEKMVNVDLNQNVIPALNQFAVDVNASVDAAALSERNAHDSEEVAKRKAGEASGSAGAAKVSEDNAKVSETNALASKNAAALSAESAEADRIAAEAARDEAQDLANVGYASESHAGLAKVDGKTTQADAGGVITVKDVAIGGDLGDLASARGQVGNYRTRFAAGQDLNDATQTGVYAVSPGCANVPMNGTSDYYVLEVLRDNSNVNAVTQFIHSRVNTAGPTWSRRRISDGTWQPWQQLVQTNYIGDGVRVSRSKALPDGTGGLCILSVPEYEGATALTAGTSGLVPPAAAGQRESFLTGGGEYKPALSTSGGVMTGSIQINDPANDIAVAPPANTERGMFLGDKNSVVMGGFDVIQRASDNAKYTQFYSKNSSGHITSLAAVTYEDGTRELVADSPLQVNDIQIKQVVDGGRRVIVLSGARGNQGHSFRFSPDTGEAYMDGRVIHAKADTAGYADTAGSAPANGGTAWAANRLRREGGVDTVWNWAGQGGQPGWLWGGNDGTNMYVYNPANFSVNYANSAYISTAVSGVWFGRNNQTVPSGGTWRVITSINGKVDFMTVAGGTSIPHDWWYAVRVA